MLPVAAAIMLAIQPTVVAADQNDPRLDRLFAVLHTSTDVRELDLAQSLIWDIWTAHDDSAVSRLMHRGMFAVAQERNAEALRMFDHVIRIDPDFAEAWNKRATLYFVRV